MLRNMMFLGLVIAWAGSCSNEIPQLSSSTQEEAPAAQDAQAANAKIGEDNNVVSEAVEQIPAPKEWPACWLSSRLSSTEAVVKERDSDFTVEIGRQEFLGKSANPITSGDCVINWFGQDNPDEPWVAEMETSTGGIYDSVVTCTADSTPDCTCMTIIPSDPIGNPTSPLDDVPFIVGNCVRRSDTGRLVIYNVRNPELLGLTPANGACDGTNGDIASVLNEKRSDIALRQEDGSVTLSNGDSCRVDVEPFSPREDEKDWYADAIRDWAVVTCEDEVTSCRSYVLFYKSGEDQGMRGSMTETGLMLICKDGTCQQVWEK